MEHARFPVLFSAAAALFLVASIPASAQASAEFGTAFSQGEHREIVYRSASSADPMSLLVWPIPPSLGAWLRASAAVAGHLDASAYLRVSLPLAAGVQTDDDWDIGPGSQVHSESRAHLVSDSEARFELLYGIELPGIEVEPGLGFSYQYINWQGWGAVQTITRYDGSVDSYYYYNLIFTYEQKWLIPYLALRVRGTLGALLWRLGLDCSPYLWCEAYDHHVANATNLFYDRPRGGWMLKPSCALEYRASDRLSLIASGEFRWIGGLRGDTVQAATQSSLVPIAVENALLEDQAGASQFRMDVLLGARYSAQ
jgi:outer membrane protease